MKTTLFISIAALAAAASLSGCTSDDDGFTTGEIDDSSIRFGATADYLRAGDITTYNLTEFNVYAFQENSATPYMDNVTVKKTDNNVWSYSPTAYWPSKGSLSFYACAPDNWVGKNSPLKAIPWDNFSDAWTPATTDLVYAVSPNITGNSSYPNAQVVFNFRHALSKVTVKMSSSNTNLKVNVTNVVLVGLKSRGNFHFPKGNTAEAASADNIGSWSDQNTPLNLTLHMAQTPDEIITLTTTPTDMGDTGLGFGGSKFIIPQLLNWRSNGMGTDTYIGVMCSIYDATTGVKLWPNDNTPEENIVVGSTFGDGLLKFPLSTSSFSEWYPGYHYVYNLIINSNEEMGSIEFGTPTVDSFVEVTTTYE